MNNKNNRITTILLYAIVSFVIVLFCSITLLRPVFEKPEKKDVFLTLTATSLKSDISWGNEVRIKSIFLNNSEYMDLVELSKNDGWQMEGDLLCAYGINQPVSIPLELKNFSSIEIILVGQCGSGFFEITSEDIQVSEVLDLYRDDWEDIKWSHYNGSKFSIIQNWSLFLGFWCILAGGLIIFELYASKMKSGTRTIYKCVVCFFGIVLVAGAYWGKNTVLGSLIMLSFVALYYGLILAAFKISGVSKLLKNLDKKNIILSILSFGIVLFAVYALMTREKFIYYWDYSGFWTPALAKANETLADPKGSLYWLYVGICNDEYNKWIPMIMALPLKLLGGSYLSYTLLKSIMFVTPTALVYTLVIEYIQNLRQSKVRIPFWIVFFLLNSAMPFLYPSLLGYADAACLLYVSVLVLLAITTDFKKYSLKHSALISAVILHLALMRRAYCFVIIAYAVALWLMMLAEMYLHKESRKQVFSNYAKNLFTIFAICASILIVCFGRYIITILTSNIFEAYSAWGKVIQAGKYKRFFSNYGLIVLFFVLCSIKKIDTKNENNYRSHLFLWCFLLPMLVYKLIYGDGFTDHGFYWIDGQMLVLFVLGFLEVLYLLQDHARMSKLITYGLYVTCSMNALIGFGIIEPDPLLVFQSIQYSVRERKDIYEVRQLEEDLTDLYFEGKQIYILSSSNLLNDDTVRNCDLPEFGDQDLSVLQTAHADLRDGFPTIFLDADIVVVPDRYQLHLYPEDQQVITVLSDYITGSLGENNYTKLPNEYTLEDGTEVYLYERIEPIDMEDLYFLRDVFNVSYAAHPELFEDRIDEYLSTMQ